jgi:NAD dependent epimerase/dehydratase family enzyme
LPLIKLGIGGPLGSGKQWWAFISLQDEAAAILHLINNTQTSGAYNLTAPEPATCEQIVKSLAKGLRRPALLRVPSWAMKLLIGEAAVELLLCSQKMRADRLIESGFVFSHPTLEEASAYVLSEELPS